MKSDPTDTSDTAGTEDQGPAEPGARRRRMPPLLKFGVDMGPLLLFVGTVFRFDIWTATAVFMIAFTAALAVAYAYERRVSPMQGITGGLVLVLGSLTLFLEDETFIKMKPTIVNLLFASVLLAGFYMRRLFIRMLLSEAVQLDEAGWRKLTIRWVGFFFFLALLNEAIWRNFSTEFWAAFKIWGVFPLTLLFGAAQVPLFQKHMVHARETSESSGPG
ncbi:MAG: septation protein A [Alphaproteobacteria bacterium]